MTDLSKDPLVGVIIVALLNIIGGILKSSKYVRNEWIPLLLIVCGTLIFCLFRGFERQMIQDGVYAALSAIGVHQTARMFGEIFAHKKDEQSGPDSPPPTPGT